MKNVTTNIALAAETAIKQARAVPLDCTIMSELASQKDAAVNAQSIKKTATNALLWLECADGNSC